MAKTVPFVPNAITAFGLTCGLFIIFKVNMVDPGEGTYQGQLITTGLLLMAAVADVLDGAVARAMRAESVFGGFFDSLADAITFGVAPSVVVLKSLSVEPGTQLSFFVTLGAILFSLCGVLRLVRFNVSSVEAQSDAVLNADHKKNFTGLPIPGAAAALVALNLFLISPDLHHWIRPSDELRACVLAPAMGLLGYLMISRWRFPSVKTLQVRVSSFGLVVTVVVMAVAMFYGVLYHFSLLFLIVAWAYPVTGWGLSIAKLIAGRDSKALESFEMEPEEDE